MQTEPSTLSRALVLDGQVSLAVLDTTALVREAAKRHALKKGSLKQLAKTLTAAGYLCGWLKSTKSSLTVSVASRGEFGKISVLGDGSLNLRGYVENNREAGSLGGGALSVVRDDGDGLPFAGTVPLVSEEIGENFIAYFRESEQIKTGIALSAVLDGSEVLRAGGVFLQALPFADEKARSFVESGAERFKEFLDTGNYGKIFGELGAKDILTREMKFSCRCSEKRVESLIFSMGEEDAFALLKERGQISVHCEYCNADYIFGEDRIRELFRKHEG